MTRYWADETTPMQRLHGVSLPLVGRGLRHVPGQCCHPRRETRRNQPAKAAGSPPTSRAHPSARPSGATAMVPQPWCLAHCPEAQQWTRLAFVASGSWRLDACGGRPQSQVAPSALARGPGCVAARFSTTKLAAGWLLPSGCGWQTGGVMWTSVCRVSVHGLVCCPRTHQRMRDCPPSAVGSTRAILAAAWQRPWQIVETVATPWYLVLLQQTVRLRARNVIITVNHVQLFDDQPATTKTRNLRGCYAAQPARASWLRQAGCRRRPK